jgi:pimeloyl-ACP methyl ester carboxylesterase
VAPSQLERRTRYAKAGSFNIAYQVLGEGPIDLVLSPGWVTHLDLAWDVPDLARFLRRLASVSRLILFDERGMGLSDGDPSVAFPTLEQRVEDVLAVMDAAGSERAVVLGTLGGAAVCTLLAATCPERAVALVLYGAFARLDPATGLLARIGDTTEAALDRLEREWGTERVGVAFWAPSLVGDDPVVSAYLRLLRSGVSPGSAKALVQVWYRVDGEVVLPSVHVPTLVLHRTGDLVVPVRQGRRLADRIPNATFAELAGIDHLMWVGDQDSVIDRIQAFLARVRPAAATDRKLVTILSTDVGNAMGTPSRLAARDRRELLGAHRAVIRANLERYGGHEVRTSGDSFLVTFMGPARAIRCADAIIKATRPLGLQVRSGIHSGDCEVLEDEPRGIAVHIAARVGAAARPGEILVTRIVKELAAGAGIGFGDRGAHALTGVQGQWELFQAALHGR